MWQIFSFPQNTYTILLSVGIGCVITPVGSQGRDLFVLITMYTVTNKPSGPACTLTVLMNDYIVNGPAGHYNKWPESWKMFNYWQSEWLIDFKLTLGSFIICLSFKKSSNYGKSLEVDCFPGLKNTCGKRLFFYQLKKFLPWSNSASSFISNMRTRGRQPWNMRTYMYTKAQQHD